MRRAFLGVLGAVLLAGTGWAGPPEGEARTGAESWVALVDARKYAESWTEASGMFRKGVTKEKWVEMAGKAREPFGPLRSRRFLGAEFAKSLPGVPDGDYAIVRFQTAFEKKAAAIETISMTAEDGKWKVAGYFIR